tara:strand:- start:1843 stop:1959 length:117 start_codon:yes stop_codon:yes gene_type:complete
MEDWKPTKLYCTHCGKKCHYDGDEIGSTGVKMKVEFTG